MRRMRLLIVSCALVCAAAVVVIGVSALGWRPSRPDRPSFTEWASKDAYDHDPFALETIEEEEVAYGAPVARGSIEVLPPDPGQAPATEPSVRYEGGFIYARYSSSSGNTVKVKLAANGSSGTMTGFYADNSTHKIPLRWGEGEYTITFMEMIGTQARTISTIRVQCGGTATASADPATPATGKAATSSAVDTTDAYLSPLTDINWSDDLTSVKKARELCKDLTTDKEKAKAIYTHLVSRLSYDYDLVGKLPSGYTPDMDKTYDVKTGICYDFASLYAGMMRSVGVKCKLEMGYNTRVDGYHAWNKVYYDGDWHRIDLTIDTQLRESKSSYSFSAPKGEVTSTSKSY